MININPALGKVESTKAIIILRFTCAESISSNEFFRNVQETLYDEIGATRHFRMAPATLNDLTESFIIGSDEEMKGEFYRSESGEFLAAFLIDQVDADVSIESELENFSLEMNLLCENGSYKAAQVDIDTMY